MNKIVTMGEMMLRLTPQGYKRFAQAECFDATYGGGEANVAVSLAHFGQNTVFCSKFPANAIGDAAIAFLRKNGVDASKIVQGDGRLGIYFLEKGASQRPSKVIYDRANSAFSTLQAEELDITGILEGADWFHFTGITPALSQTALDTLLVVLSACKDKGITVSCDLNYRNKLWSKDAAKRTMTMLMSYINVLIANEEDVSDVFGIHPANTDIEKGELNISAYKDMGKLLIDKFNLEKVAFTLRGSISASVNEWSGMLIDKDDCFLAPNYTINIVDRVGGGDSFGAGLIYSLLKGKNGQEAINFAVAASCLKQTIEGDVNLVTVKEVEHLMHSGGSGRVQR